MSKKSRQHKIQGKRKQETPAGKTVPIASQTNKPWQIVAVCILLAALTVFVYRSSQYNDFLNLDDYSYVLENRNVQHGLTTQSIAWAFTTFEQGNWHPLTWISHIIDWSIYGNHPGGQHMTSVYWHAANSVLLFLLLLYLTGLLGRSAVVAFLFALHPIHVESVAWISERKDVLCAFFFLCTLIAYVWYVRNPSLKRYAAVIIAFACALMSKPMAVTLPLILLLFDFWPLHRIDFAPESHPQFFSTLKKLCIEKWPLFIMAVISSVVTVLAQKTGGAVGSFQAFPLGERIGNAAISYCRYVMLAFWPHPLLAYYYYDLNHLMISAAVLSLVALVVVSVICWKLRQKKPYILVGWLWFLLTLIPVIGIIQVGVQAMAERYTYIPIIGIFISVVWLVSDAAAKSPARKLTAQLLAVAVIAACAVMTSAQVKVWKNTVTLFNHVFEYDTRGKLPNTNMGVALMRQARNAEAQKYFERALSFDPNSSLTLTFSAFCLMRTMMQTHDPSNLPLAGQRLQHALSITPDDPQALTYMALWSALNGRPKDQETYSRRVIAIKSEFIQARLYLGDSLGAQGKFDEAIQAYRQVLLIDPNNTDALNSIGIAYESQGSMDQAMKQFQLSLAVQPDQSVPHSHIGMILAQEHRLPDALGEFAQAVRYDPSNASAHNDYGVALFQLGNLDKAIEQFSDALQIQPSFARAKLNFDIAQAQLKNKNAVAAKH